MGWILITKGPGRVRYSAENSCLLHVNLGLEFRLEWSKKRAVSRLLADSLKYELTS